VFAQQSLQPKLSRRCYASVSYALQNNTVFRCAQNWVSVSDWSWTDNGSEFQSVGPETAKHLWPYLVVLKRGTARSLRAAERRWPRLADLDTSEHSSARYVVAACRGLKLNAYSAVSLQVTACIVMNSAANLPIGSQQHTCSHKPGGRLPVTFPAVRCHCP